MKHHNKLIRDKIPEILEALGEKCEIAILPEAEYRDELDRKLTEEVLEYLRAKDVEELVDVLEVVYSIAKVHGVTEDQLNGVRLRKAEKNGRFNSRIMLKRVWKDTE